MTTKITEKELDSIITRILKEEETRAKYNNEEFIGLTNDDICQKIVERIGCDWEIE